MGAVPCITLQHTDAFSTETLCAFGTWNFRVPQAYGRNRAENRRFRPVFQAEQRSTKENVWRGFLESIRKSQNFCEFGPFWFNLLNCVVLAARFLFFAHQSLDYFVLIGKFLWFVISLLSKVSKIYKFESSCEQRSGFATWHSLIFCRW